MASTFHVRLMPAASEFETDGRQSILESALQAQVPMPRSCRNGTCRACRCRLSSGQIRYRIEWPGLSADEKEDGWILPCVAMAVSDLVITL